MKRAKRMILLTLAVPTLALASAEPEDAWEPPPEPQPMFAAWGASAEVFGSGVILEARLEDHGGAARLAVRTRRGWTTADLRIGLSDGAYNTVEELRLVGNRVVIEIEEYHDPCGCDDGPTWSYSHRTRCRVVQGGRVVCSAPRTVLTHDDRPWD
jgi:hypothetical protein